MQCLVMLPREVYGELALAATSMGSDRIVTLIPVTWPLLITFLFTRTSIPSAARKIILS